MWQRDLVIPVVAVGLTIALIPSLSLRPFGVLYEQFIAPRLNNSRARLVLSTIARTDDLTLAALLGVATLFIVLDLSSIARLIELGIAGLAMLEAAMGVWIGATIDRRMRSRAQSRAESRARRRQ